MLYGNLFHQGGIDRIHGAHFRHAQVQGNGINAYLAGLINDAQG